MNQIGEFYCDMKFGERRLNAVGITGLNLFWFLFSLQRSTPEATSSMEQSITTFALYSEEDMQAFRADSFVHHH